jgi:hypothetical protein
MVIFGLKNVSSFTNTGIAMFQGDKFWFQKRAAGQFFILKRVEFYNDERFRISKGNISVSKGFSFYKDEFCRVSKGRFSVSKGAQFLQRRPFVSQF